MTASAAQLAELVAEVAEVDVAEVRPERTLADIGVDSLTAIEIAVDVERKYGVRFTEDELKTLSTFGSLVALAQSKVGAAAS